MASVPQMARDLQNLKARVDSLENEVIALRARDVPPQPVPVTPIPIPATSSAAPALPVGSDEELES